MVKRTFVEHCESKLPHAQASALRLLRLFCVAFRLANDDTYCVSLESPT